MYSSVTCSVSVFRVFSVCRQSDEDVLLLCLFSEVAMSLVSKEFCLSIGTKAATDSSQSLPAVVAGDK